jgi:hypothetical protein
MCDTITSEATARNPGSSSLIGLTSFPGIDVKRIAGPFADVLNRSGIVIEWIAAMGAGLGNAATPRVVRHIEEGVADLSLLVVPCDFARSPGLEGRNTVLALNQAIRQAANVVLIARTAKEARCAQMLLQPVSRWSPGAFWEQFRADVDPRQTRFIADGLMLWAVGHSAATEVATLVCRPDFARLFGLASLDRT